MGLTAGRGILGLGMNRYPKNLGLGFCPVFAAVMRAWVETTDRQQQKRCEVYETINGSFKFSDKRDPKTTATKSSADFLEPLKLSVMEIRY